jgi:hypothetical protein
MPLGAGTHEERVASKGRFESRYFRVVTANMKNFSFCAALPLN